MADLRFKIQQLDAGAAHWLGWAKKEVRRLAELMPAFTRTWVHGDVTVRAQYHEESGTARLWLEAAATERLAVWATLPNPAVYRAVGIGSLFYGKPSWTTEFVDGGPDLVTKIKNSAGEVVESVYGRGPEAVYSEVHGWGMSYFNTPIHVGNWVGVSNGIQWPDSPGIGYTLVHPTYEELLQQDMAEDRGGVISYVQASDGEILAREEYDYELETTPGPAGRGVGFITESVVGMTARFVNTTGMWTGAERTAMYLNGHNGSVGNVLSFHHWLEFSVPEDAVYEPPATMPPADPLLSARVITTEDGYRFAPYETAGDADVQPLGSVVDLMDEWGEGNELARERAKAWRQKTADDLLDEIRRGVFTLPQQWGRVIKELAPVSSNVRRAWPLHISVNTETINDTSNNLTQDGTLTQQRTVQCEYVADTGEGQEFRTGAFVGTYSITIVSHYDAQGVYMTATATHSYNNWYENEPPAALPLNGVYYPVFAFIRDQANQCFGAFWSGTYQTGFSENSLYGVPSAQPIRKTFDAPLYNPPIPTEYCDVSSSVPEFFVRYHKEAPHKYRPEELLDDTPYSYAVSRLDKSASIHIVLLSLYTAREEQLGLFGQVEDGEDGEISEVELLGVMSLGYAYETGGLSVLGWRNLSGVRVQLAEPLASIPGNALLIYGGIKWDDVKEKARAQRKALNDPNDPAHDPLMKAVLDALKPTSP